jgi:iron complex transport system substrate-binding protein
MRAPALRYVELPGGARGLADAGGHVVPLRHYARIASGTSVADDLLLALAEPERVVVLSAYGREHSAEPHRYGARKLLGGPTHVEMLKREGVDLLLLHHLGAPTELERVREAGLEVFNLGHMRGLTTLRDNIEIVAALLGQPERGRYLSEKLVRRMGAVAADIPKNERKRGLYVSAYGGQLFGGGKGTSYNDVLEAAGLIDVAAASYRDWPHYDPEQVLQMDPDVVVTSQGSADALCRVSGLEHLRACQQGGRGVVAMDDALMGDPGLSMLDAAETVRDLVYGARP